MATHVAFRKIDSGEIKTVKVGWSWTLFLFWGVLGMPWFMRKVSPYGVIGIAISIGAVMQGIAGGEPNPVFPIVGLIASVGLGLRGNKLTAEYYLKHGWELADPDSSEVEYAREKWALV